VPAAAAPVAASGSAPPPTAAAGAAVVTTTTTVAPAAAPTAPTEVAWDLLHRRYNTWSGPTGGLFLLDGRAGEPGAIRVQLGLDGFVGSNILLEGDHISVSEQSLSLSGTVTENLELFAALANRTANETRPDHRTLDSIGDVSLGGKLGTQLSDVVDVGADLRLTFLNKVGGGGFDWGATSVWLRSALGIDLQRMEKPVPLIFRFNAGYLLDNSSVTIRGTENDRYEQVVGAQAKSDEVRHLINRFERLAMGVNRIDRFTFGAGAEVPLELAKQFYMHPIVEWQLGLPVNRQKYDCPFVASDPLAGERNAPQGDDSCYERSPSVMPMNLTLAVRVVPPVRGLSALLGVDIGLTGTDKFVRELQPNLPWRFMFAISYDYDARPAPPPVQPPPVAAVIAPAPVVVNGRVRGLVTTPDGQPVADARVRFTEQPLLTALATGADGRFVSEPLTPGAVALEVSHPDYEPTQCAAVLLPGAGDAEVRCTMTPKPLYGKLQGQVLDAWGAPVAGARVILSGPSNAMAVSDARGAFSADQLSPGSYSLRVEAAGYFVRNSRADIEARSTSLLSPSLTRKPITPSVTISGHTMDAPALTFKTDTSTELNSAALESIAEIADYMLTRTDLYLQVQGYGTDAVASARALLIKQRLVEAGVAESHIEAVGGGKNRVRLTLHE
jgi:OmpA-OmpF porin, OOP family